jgi:hypothetical protein
MIYYCFLRVWVCLVLNRKTWGVGFSWDGEKCLLSIQACIGSFLVCKLMWWLFHWIFQGAIMACVPGIFTGSLVMARGGAREGLRGAWHPLRMSNFYWIFWILNKFWKFNKLDPFLAPPLVMTNHPLLPVMRQHEWRCSFAIANM